MKLFLLTKKFINFFECIIIPYYKIKCNENYISMNKELGIMIDISKFKLLKRYLAECVNKGIFPGACFGLVTKHESVFDDVGYSQLRPTLQNISINTVYDLASLSKVVSTTTIIMKLVEAGEIVLFDKVVDIIPEFRHKDITIYNLLTHTSGLPADINNYKVCKSKKEIIDKIYSTDLEYGTGKKVLYSDIGFILLGIIIEQITGSLDGYFDKNIATPLGMMDTCYNPSEEIKARCAATEYKEERGYIKGTVHDGKAFIMGGISGHAGLFSTVKDLGNFCSMMLNNGVFNNLRILSENSIKLLSRCHTLSLNENRGLGWQLKDFHNAIGDLASDNSIFHTGFSGTSLLIDFDNQFAFILLTNRIHPSRENNLLIKLRRNINNIAETVIY